MVEYVYARHDFIPEHEDEVAFRAGERIEVVEKDDLFNDGWWQRVDLVPFSPRWRTGALSLFHTSHVLMAFSRPGGRNLAGKVGLFPESYTQPAPPNAEPPATAPTSLPPADETLSSAPSLPNGSAEKTSLHPSLQEGSHHTDVMNDATPNHSTPQSNGEVMRATLTDVQQAIEQLGHKDDLDGSRSFTFSSLRDESTDRETDHDTDADADGEDWHRGARQKLAEKAKKAVEEQAARDAADGRVPRSGAPPIDVQLSDDSEDEGDGPSVGLPPNDRHRQHPHILEEEEDPDVSPPHRQGNSQFSYSPSIQPSDRFIVPSPVSTAPHPGSELTEDAATEAGVSTATQPSFPLNEGARTPENNSSLPSPVSPGLRGISNGISATANDAANHLSSAHLAFPSKTQTLSLKEVAGVLPSPAASSDGHRHGYSISSVTSSARVAASSPLSAAHSPDLFANKKPRNVHPSEWGVEDVIYWLRSKGFDDMVCDKFIEQEITGDVLLELDVVVLKSEIGILAYGKRIRIANAIADLRRPSSVLSSADQPTRPESLFHGGSPLAQQGTPFSPAPVALGSAGLGSIMSAESPPNSGDSTRRSPLPASRGSDPGIRPSVTDSDATVGLGLGIPPALLAGGHNRKGRPPQLSLSPSDPALRANVPGIPGEHEVEEDRGVLSDSETKNVVTKRSNIFRRQNSSSSTGKASSPRKSKEVPTSQSNIAQLGDGVQLRPQARKRSLDATRENNTRLSIFGTTFAGTLGKARKPPPRYSASTENEVSPGSALSLSRFYYGNGSRKSSTRSDGGANRGKEDHKREKRDSRDSISPRERKDPVLLRKPASPTVSTGGPRTGKGILEQIGIPDHKGWMRKKGENYNTWKSRYFLLKGPHLYWLKSNNATETKIKGYVNIVGYRIVADENIDPGRYGFKLLHESDRDYYFSSDEQMAIREWMKALMKATIDRDYSKPVVSSVNVPTIPLAVAQAMNPAPRPPSPTARAATQRAMRRENTNQLSTRDAEILMSMAPTTDGMDRGGNRPRIESFFSELDAESPVTPSTSPKLLEPPVRPPREMRRQKSTSEITSKGSICGGLELLRIAESIKGVRNSTVPDGAFPRRPNDNALEGLFQLFDFLLDNDVKMGTVSINDVRQGKRDKIAQLLRALRAWEEKRQTVLQSIGKSSMQAGPFVA
ncbi:hypothetical protein BJV74DRAFT_989158 [Russula compacta]|nr:hypothetical protein BJV74DRAFT_989158 [Russula compacta]